MFDTNRSTITITESNPIAFIDAICEKIHEGYFVTNDIVGHPVMGWPMYITLTEGAEPALRSELGPEIHTVVVEGWNIMSFLLDVQSVIQQGFTMNGQKAVYGDYKSFIFERAKPVVLDLKPAVKAKEPEPEAAPAEDKPAPAKKTRAKKGE